MKCRVQDKLGTDLFVLHLVFGILVVLAAVACLDFGVPWLLGRLARYDLRRRTRRSRALVLTFDDGPGHRLTPAILAVLAERNVKATFFLLGRNIAGREAIVRQIADRGHEICSHGFSHAHPWKAGPLRVISDIVRGWRAIDGVWSRQAGRYAFRPPYGKIDLATLVYLWIKRVAVCYWTVDSGDTSGEEAWSCGRAAERVHRDGGGVVLTHDLTGRRPASIGRFWIP